MIVSVVVTICHMVLTQPPEQGYLVDPDRMQPAEYLETCHDDVLAQEDMPLQVCMLSQPQIAYWKEHSIYATPAWKVKRWRCIPGKYVVKEQI